MFKVFDKNGDKTITVKEMATGLKDMGFNMDKGELKAAVKKIDANGNGLIEYGEFRTFMLKQFKQSQSSGDKQKEIKQAFRLFDRDGNGFIERGEFKKAMKALGEPLTEAELTIMIKEADKDGDGKINYEEFVQLWMKKLEEQKKT
ncbi:calmodulin-beta-like [Mya arenaria]|uniref:calmodulin-beta-like n=1 Tax=Mya arenaria TaxID=6604 RepID=UPI0022E384E6|nr:calmodulin-beta-like [Mya arenaria]XP_052764012.1 calmodulin-beta-like [Mya arenaria]